MNILIALIIGIVAGIIDIIPMFIQKLDKHSIISAFIQWIVVAFVVTHISFGVEGWLKGLIVAVLMALPIIVLVVKNDAKAAVPMILMSVILGSLVGFAGNIYVK